MPDKNFRKVSQYIVHHQGEALGPFDVKFIEAMVMSGVYPPSVVVENSNSKERIKFSSVVPPAKNKSKPSSHSSARASSTRATNPSKSKRKPSRAKSETTLIVVSSIIGVLFMVWLISLFKSDFTSSKVANNSTPEETSYRASKKASSNNTESTSQRSSNSSSWYSSNHSSDNTEVTSQRNSNSSSWYSSKPSPKTTASNYTKARITQPSVDTMVYRDASGRTYSLSNSNYYRLQSMKLSLSSKEVSLITEKSHLKSLGAAVDVSRSMLDRTSQSQIDAFNRKVSRFNEMNGTVQSLVDDYNRDVDSFNRELERVGTPIH